MFNLKLISVGIGTYCSSTEDRFYKWINHVYKVCYLTPGKLLTILIMNIWIMFIEIYFDMVMWLKFVKNTETMRYIDFLIASLSVHFFKLFEFNCQFDGFGGKTIIAVIALRYKAILKVGSGQNFFKHDFKMMVERKGPPSASEPTFWLGFEAQDSYRDA